jgi:biotin operon repressor
MEDKNNEFYVVSVEDTINYGIVSAAIIGRIRHWCNQNKKNKRKDCYHIECWWSGFMSSKEFAKQLGVPSKTIEKHLSKLLKDGIIIKGVFNKKGFDRTGWYRVNANPQIEECISPNRVDDLPNQSKCISPNRVNGFPPVEETIPVITSVSKTISQSVSTSVSKTVNPTVELTNFDRNHIKDKLYSMNLGSELLTAMLTMIEPEGYLTKKQRELIEEEKYKFNKIGVLQPILNSF